MCHRFRSAGNEQIGAYATAVLSPYRRRDKISIPRGRMQQVQFSSFGGPDVLDLIVKPTPAPGSDEVLVRVRAIGVNFAETLMRENRYAVTPDLPAVPGTEVAGIVERLGDKVEGLWVGTRVAVPLFATGAVTGGYSDHVVVNAALAVPLPETIS